MTLEKIGELAKDAVVENITLDSGKSVLCKKIKKDTILSMEAFLPEIKNYTDLFQKGISDLSKFDGVKIFEAVGDPSKYMKSKDGRVFSQEVNNAGQIIGNPGFVESDIVNQAKTAATAMKVVPWVGLAIAVIEVGVKIVNNQKQIKAEEKEFYAKHMEELSEQYDYLWDIMNDYTYFIKDDALRSSYFDKITTAYNVSKRKYNKMKEIIETSKKVSEDMINTMHSALIIFSMANLLKILYSKTDCKEYIQKAVDDINEKTNELNLLIDNAIEKNKIAHTKVKKVGVVAGRVFVQNFDNPFLRVGVGILSLGATEGLRKIPDKIEDTFEKNYVRQTENIIALKLLDNPYTRCIDSIASLTGDDNIVLMNDDYLYVQVPEVVQC